jgi:hypothetical protein
VIRPADQIKLRAAAKVPEKVDARAKPLFRYMKIDPPAQMSRAHKLAWYAKRVMEYEHALDNIADRQSIRQMVFSQEARESNLVDAAMIRRMIPKAKELFQMELKLHRMEMYKTMLRHHVRVEKNPLSPNEESKQARHVEGLISGYKKVEEDMIHVLNDPKELEKRTRRMIDESRQEQ